MVAGMIKCSFDNGEIEVIVKGPWIISECMLLMEKVAKQLEKDTTVDWRIHLQNMVKVMVADELSDDELETIAKHTMDGKIYKAPTAE